MEEGGSREKNMASSCIYVIASWCICICIFVLSVVDGDNMGYMLSCGKKEATVMRQLWYFLCFCVIQIFLRCEKKTWK